MELTIIKALCIWLLLGLFSCKEDDPTEVITQLNAPQSAVAFDHGNNGNASDVIIFFTQHIDEDKIKEYRAYVMKESNPLEAIDLIERSNFQTVESNQHIRLNETLKDVDGEDILSKTSYFVSIVSLGDSLKTIPNSKRSKAFTLENRSYYDVETFASLPGVESLVFNPHTHSIYTPNNNAGEILEVNAKTGVYNRWVSNVDGGKGGFGGSFNSDYTKYYLSFWSSNSVGEYDISSQSWRIIAENISGPTGTAVDSEGNVYVASYWEDRIYRIDTEGNKTTYSSGGALHSVDGIIFINNTLFAINFEIPTIAKIAASGTASLFATLPNSAPRTGYMTFAGDYIYAGSETRMYRIDLNGRVETVFGTSQATLIDGPAPFARTSGLALGITSNARGDSIFFAESNKIRLLIKRD